MTLDPSGSQLFVAQDNADQVAVIDTCATGSWRRSMRARRMDCCRSRNGNGNGMHGDGNGEHPYTGAATFAVTLSPDGNTLYAVNSGRQLHRGDSARGEECVSR